VCKQLAHGCTQQHGGWDSNPRPIDHKSGFITTRPLSHTFEMYSNANVLAVTGS